MTSVRDAGSRGAAPARIFPLIRRFSPVVKSFRPKGSAGTHSGVRRNADFFFFFFFSVRSRFRRQRARRQSRPDENNRRHEPSSARLRFVRELLSARPTTGRDDREQRNRLSIIFTRRRTLFVTTIRLRAAVLLLLLRARAKPFGRTRRETQNGQATKTVSPTATRPVCHSSIFGGPCENTPCSGVLVYRRRVSYRARSGWL